MKVVTKDYLVDSLKNYTSEIVSNKVDKSSTSDISITHTNDDGTEKSSITLSDGSVELSSPNIELKNSDDEGLIRVTNVDENTVGIYNSDGKNHALIISNGETSTSSNSIMLDTNSTKIDGGDGSDSKGTIAIDGDGWLNFTSNQVAQLTLTADEHTQSEADYNKTIFYADYAPHDEDEPDVSVDFKNINKFNIEASNVNINGNEVVTKNAETELVSLTVNGETEATFDVSISDVQKGYCLMLYSRCAASSDTELKNRANIRIEKPPVLIDGTYMEKTDSILCNGQLFTGISNSTTSYTPVNIYTGYFGYSGTPYMIVKIYINYYTGAYYYLESGKFQFKLVVTSNAMGGNSPIKIFGRQMIL